MKNQAIGLLSILCGACATVPAQANAGAATGALVYIGTWGEEAPPASGAHGAKPAAANGPVGIYAARLDERNGQLTPLGLQAALDRADALVVDPDRSTLYSVAASSQGMRAPSDVYSFRIDPGTGTLRLIDKASSGGRDATAVALEPRSSTLFVGNHGSGDVVSMPIRSDGSLDPATSIEKEYGKGPTQRQQGPQVHGVAVDPSGRNVVTADFGADRIFVYRFDPATRKLSPAQPPFASLPAGAGPRHVVFAPNGRYAFLITELSGVVQSYHWDAHNDHLGLIQTISQPSQNGEADKGGADIEISKDGRFLYFSIRGSTNSIFVYAVDQATGHLNFVQRIGAQGQRPWAFGIDPSGRWMIVANMGSQALSVLKIDPLTGRLTATGVTMPVPNPAAVGFFRK